MLWECVLRGIEEGGLQCRDPENYPMNPTPTQGRHQHMGGQHGDLWAVCGQARVCLADAPAPGPRWQSDRRPAAPGGVCAAAPPQQGAAAGGGGGYGVPDGADVQPVRAVAAGETAAAAGVGGANSPGRAG